MPNQEIMREWVARLRSGNYAQGRGRLHMDDRYCCLGVLSEMAYERGVVREQVYAGEVPTFTFDGVQPARQDVYSYNGASTMPPAEVYKWAGIVAGDSWDPVGNAPLCGNALAHRNDGGTPFDRIADLIEAEWIDLPEDVEVPDSPADITEKETVCA